MSRRNRVPAAERKATLHRYRKALASGLSPSAAGRLVGCDRLTLQRWIEAERDGAPVAIVRDRACLGGCGNTIRSDGPHRRLCDNCSAKIGSLPAAWSA